MSPIYHFFRLPLSVLALLVAVAPAAFAQFGDFDPGLEFPGLSEAALHSMHAAATKLFEGRPVGAFDTWTSPDGTASGQAKLLRSFDAYNMPCRTIEDTVSVQGTLSTLYPSHYVLTWCRLPAGVWKIVPVPTAN